MIVPGESVSMLGQVPLYADASQIIVFKPSSMNDSHDTIFKQSFELGYLSYFDKDGKVISPSIVRKREKDDAFNVVEAIINGIKEKTNSEK